jgi:hypothetical protein
MPKPNPKESAKVKPGSKAIIKQAITDFSLASAIHQAAEKRARKIFKAAEAAFQKAILAALDADDAEDAAR